MDLKSDKSGKNSAKIALVTGAGRGPELQSPSVHYRIDIWANYHSNHEAAKVQAELTG
jgi:hypothetical protein